MDFESDYLPSRGEKPFLPDIHLKSATLKDLIDEVGSLLLDPGKVSLDSSLTKTASVLRQYLCQQVGVEYEEIGITYGLNSIRYYSSFWDTHEIDHMKQSVTELISSNWDTFLAYLRWSVEMISKDINYLLNPLGINKLVESILHGLPSSAKEQLKSQGENFYQAFIGDIMRKVEERRIPIDSFSVDSTNNISSNKEIFVLFGKMDRLTTLRNLMISKQIKKKNHLNIMNLFSHDDCGFTDQFVLIRLGENRYILFDYNQLMLISDTVSSRFLTLLFVSLYSAPQSILLPSPDLINEYYRWCDKVLYFLGNEGYNIIKKVEPFCIAVCLRKWDKLTDSSNFLDHLLSDSGDLDKNYLYDLIRILEKCQNPNQLFEIFGLYRHAGHPLVDEETGCIKMKEVTRDNIQLNVEIITNCLGACKKHFIMEYIRQNKHWPAISLEKTKINLLKTHNEGEILNFMEMLSKKILNINEYELSFSLPSWAGIYFLKTFDYNDYEDFTPLLSDTAISPTRSHWTNIYNYKRLKASHNRDPNYSRRTLVNLLKRRVFSNKIVKLQIQKRSLPDNYKIIVLHSKERELKINARLFAMMVLEMRMYFACTEKNVSDMLFKYVPNQTMTNSEAELNNKLLNITNLKFKQNRIAITFSLDMDKFNNRWRKDSTEPFFTMIDQLFDTENLFNYTHEFFEESLYCLSSFNHPPKYLIKSAKNTNETNRSSLSLQENIEIRELRRVNFEKESNTTWIGQGGGCEGLRQKGWTFIITSALSATEELTEIKSYIIGQGDNQVIVALFPIMVDGVDEKSYIENHSSLLTEQINMYKVELEKNINGLGMKLKLEETWVSTILMNYGKEILVDGCYMSSACKRISRAYSEVNEVQPTLSTRLSSIFSSCHSASSKFFDCLIPYSIAQTLTLYTTDQEIKGNGISNFKFPQNSDLRKKSQLHHKRIFNKSEAIIFLNLHKEFGGYPIMPIIEFLFRGHPDQLNTYFSSLNLRSNYSEEIKKIQIYIVKMAGTMKEEPINYQKLIQDPTSLNWKTSSVDTGEISRLLDTNLREIVVNEDIRVLLNKTNPKSTKDLINYLSETTPFIPRVLNEIFRQSPEGAKLHYLSIFSDMKTMKEMMSPQDSTNLIRYIMESENNMILKVYSIIKEIQNLQVSKEEFILNLWNNSFTLSEAITNGLWERTIEGSRIPHPHQQFSFCKLGNEDCYVCSLDMDHFQERIDFITPPVKVAKPRWDKKEIGPFNQYFFRGPFHPYMGSSTREKRSKSLISFPRSDKALLAAQNLFRLQDWVISPESNLYQFVTDLIKSRTELPLNVVKMASGKYYGGSVIHRFHDVVTKHTCRPNTRPNKNSHTYISSDSMGQFSGGKDNHYIHFQSSYLYGLSLSNLMYFWNPNNTYDGYHLHVKDYTSIKEIQEELIRSTAQEVPIIPLLNDSKLLYSTVTDYSDKCVVINIGESLLIDPRSHPNLIPEVSVWAAAGIAYGYMIDQSVPLIRSTILNNIGELINCPLSLDDLLEYELPVLFKKVGVLWLLDNLREILDYSYQSGHSLKESSSFLLSRLPSALFNFLRPMLCNDKILRKFKDYGWIPSSSQFTMNSSSVDKILIKEMNKGVDYFLRNKQIMTFLIPYKALSLNRLVQLYLNSILLLSDWKNPLTINKYLDNLSREFHEMTQKSEFTVQTLIKYYNSLCSLDSRLRPITSNDLPHISTCGPEPWVRSGKNNTQPVIKIKSLGDIRENLKSDAISYIKNINKIIRLKFDKTINYRDIQPGCTDQVSLKTSSNDNERQRWTHQNRLTGNYSTAQYKYSEIFSLVNQKSFQASINLAEGAGGVAKLCAQWFNCEKVIYNSLVDLNDFVSQRASTFVPPELLDLKPGIKLLGVKECVRSGGDLTSLRVIELFQQLIKNNVDYRSIMTMDAETSGIFDTRIIIDLMKNTMRLFHLLPLGSILIMKTFFWHFSFFRSVCYSIFSIHNNLRIIKPFHSSSENTEVFLMVIKKSNTPFNWKTGKCINIDLTNLAVEVIHPDVCNDSYSLSLNDMFHYHKSFRQLGFNSNFYHCLISISENLIDINRFTENPLLETATKIDSIINYFRYKLTRSGRDLQKKRVSRLYMLVSAKGHPESIDLSRLGNALLNLFILRDLLITGKLDLKWLILPLDIYDSDDSDRILLYTIDIRYHEWNKLFMRYFRRLEGHIKIILKNP